MGGCTLSSLQTQVPDCSTVYCLNSCPMSGAFPLYTTQQLRPRANCSTAEEFVNLLHAFSVLDCNQHRASAKQWSGASLSSARSGASEQLSEGRKKRHLSETAVGKRAAALPGTAALLLEQGLQRGVADCCAWRSHFSLSPERISVGP